MVDISVIVPGYRYWEWQHVFQSTKDSLEDLSFEIIFVGPDNKSGVVGENVTFIKDFGAPGRCLQIGAANATGKYLTWACDDGVFTVGSLKRAIQRMEEKNDKKFTLGLNYYEGGDPRQEEFFRMRFHADQQMPGIKEEYKSSPMFVCTTEYYKELGGLDCRFEHVNFNIHDLMFRIYNDGGEVEIFMEPTLNIAWDVHAPDYVPVRQAYLEVDLPLYQKLYAVDQSARTKIPFDNWKESPAVWVKRFGDLKV
tara:strand:+ start:348 stop:1106 length:759 start_codon:yes stop_codon:yes gene_type:complete